MTFPADLYQTCAAAAAAEGPRDAAYWAQQATNLRASAAPPDQVNTVDGRNALSPLQDFGRMWQQTYRIRLAGAAVSPEEVIRAWKAHFSSFWPRGNRFYAPLTGITPGEVAILTVRVGAMPRCPDMTTHRVAIGYKRGLCRASRLLLPRWPLVSAERSSPKGVRALVHPLD